MRLYLLRHGDATWPNWSKSDDERPLTDEGKKEMRKVAKLLEKLGVSLDEILTSPLPRARQTAEIVAERFKLHAREEKSLCCGFGAQDLKQLVRKYRVDSLMIVGHEPDFSEVISALTGGDCKMSKAGVALIDLNGSDSKGRLLWLFPPKFAKAL